VRILPISHRDELQPLQNQLLPSVFRVPSSHYSPRACNLDGNSRVLLFSFLFIVTIFNFLFDISDSLLGDAKLVLRNCLHTALAVQVISFFLACIWARAEFVFIMSNYNGVEDLEREASRKRTSRFVFAAFLK